METEQRAEHNPRAAGRIGAVVGVTMMGLVVLMLLPTTARSSGVQQGLPEGWQTVFSENFEGGIGEKWEVVTDTSTTDGGEYLWGAETFTYTSPITAAWAVGGGADGSALVAGTDNYVDNVDSWLISGPITLTKVFQAELTFDFWLDSGHGDWFSWCVMTDISDLSAGCEGSPAISGRIGTWVSGTLSLDSYALNSTPIYLAFHFTSDDDGVTGKGVFVDDVVVRGDYGQHLFLPLVRRDPTPTPSAYLDDFDSSSSGWYTGRVYRSNGTIPGRPECAEGWQEVGQVSYHSGHYRIYVHPDCRVGGWTNTYFVGPAVPAPMEMSASDHYVVEARGIFANATAEEPYQPWWAYWGIVFAANDNFTELYTFQINNNRHFSVSHFTPYQWPGGGDENYIIDLTGEVPAIKNGPNYNTLKVVVDGCWATFYVNGAFLDSVCISGLAGFPEVGLRGGAVEVTPVDLRIDYFSYRPLP